MMLPPLPPFPPVRHPGESEESYMLRRAHYDKRVDDYRKMQEMDDRLHFFFAVVIIVFVVVVPLTLALWFAPIRTITVILVALLLWHVSQAIYDFMNSRKP